MQIGKNIVEAKNQLPTTSPINTTLLKITTPGYSLSYFPHSHICYHINANFNILSPCHRVGITNVQAAQVFDLTTKRIAQAKDDESENKEFSKLMLPITRRNKLEHHMPYLSSYFKSVPPYSGISRVVSRVRFTCSFHVPAH